MQWVSTAFFILLFDHCLDYGFVIQSHALHGCASNQLAPELYEKDEETKAEAAFFLFEFTISKFQCCIFRIEISFKFLARYKAIFHFGSFSG